MNRYRIQCYILLALLVTFLSTLLVGCEKTVARTEQYRDMEQWLEKADLTDHLSKEELYQAALLEDTLVIYSVSSRIFDVKTTFEQEYPGLTVDVRDIRSYDIVNKIKNEYENEEYKCDLVVCSDCDGSLYKELLEPGIVYSYVPWDIDFRLKDDNIEQGLEFLGEAIMLVYNNEVFDAQPINNLWELTEDTYKGKIIMANPLSSFSTNGFCAALFAQSPAMEKAYEDYYGTKLIIPDGKCAGEIFWEMAAPNIIFTNSSDEVLESVGNNGANDVWIGIMISSKMRYEELGYHVALIYNLEPFAAVYTPNSITLAGRAANVNSAKLFIRYLLGEADGTGEGLQPYTTTGTWSVRQDAPDGNPVPLSDMDIVRLDKEFIYSNRESMTAFWKRLLVENIEIRK